MSTSRRGGGVSRRCECRGPDGKLLGKACPDAVKRSHGKLLVKQDLPPYKDAEGKEHRHYFRRSGYMRVGDAEADLGKVRQILDLGKDDTDALQRVTALLQQVAKDRSTPIPDVAEVKRKLRFYRDRGVPAEMLDERALAEAEPHLRPAGRGFHLGIHRMGVVCRQNSTGASASDGLP